MTLSAAKIYGPKQVGLYGRLMTCGFGHRAWRWTGGGVRSGTENVAGIIGFARALRWLGPTKDEAHRLSRLRDLLQRLLVKEFPQMIVSGPKKTQSFVCPVCCTYRFLRLKHVVWLFCLSAKAFRWERDRLVQRQNAYRMSSRRSGHP